MKKLMLLIKSNKGETLVESIVSIMILSILLVGVSAMITTSLRISHSSVNLAKEMQKIANTAILEGGSLMQPGTPPEEDKIYFAKEKGKITFKEVDNKISSSTHEIDFLFYDGIVTISPNV